VSVELVYSWFSPPWLPSWQRLLSAMLVPKQTRSVERLCDRADLDTSFPTLKRVHWSKSRVEYFSKSASILPVFCCIFNRLLKTCFWVCFSSSYDIILSYLVINSIQKSVKWGWLAYTTSTVRDICTFAVLCSVTRPFLSLHSCLWRALRAVLKGGILSKILSR